MNYAFFFTVHKLKYNLLLDSFGTEIFTTKNSFFALKKDYSSDIIVTHLCMNKSVSGKNLFLCYLLSVIYLQIILIYYYLILTIYFFMFAQQWTRAPVYRLYTIIL